MSLVASLVGTLVERSIGSVRAAGLACTGLLAGCLLAATPATPAAAAAPDRCLALAQGPGPRLVQQARFEVAQLKAAEVRITYIGHSTFLIESAAGIRTATDYNDYTKPAVVPEIVTMNRAHDTHYTNAPEPGIRHVLRGWNPSGASVPAE